MFSSVMSAHKLKPTCDCSPAEAAWGVGGGARGEMPPLQEGTRQVESRGTTHPKGKDGKQQGLG